MKRAPAPLAMMAGCALGLAACAGSVANSTGTTGGGGNGCSSTACVPPVAVPLNGWFVEIDPPSGSGAGLTEIGAGDVNFANEPVTLPADALEMVTTTFIAPANSPAPASAVPASAGVMLAVPSTIPGHAPLTFQGTASMDSSATIGTITGSIPVPMSMLMLSKQGMLTLTPLPPADRQNPPYSFSVTVAPNLPETLPAGNVTVTGQIQSAVGKPLADSLVARAFQGGNQVSTAPLTDTTDGSFKIILGTVDPTGPITVQFSPVDQNSADPWFTSSPQMLGSNATSLNLGAIMLPAYITTPNLFNVRVFGADGVTPVSGALVQAEAALGAATNAQGTIGNADFIRTATTNSQGLVALSLLPGTGVQQLDYDIAINPPASSPYGMTCLSVATVMSATSVNTPSAPTLATATLPPRPVLSGTVIDSAGFGVANVTITATSIASPASDCGGTIEASASTSSSASGQFSLPLDPGTYQLDYDPPAGSSAPRLTEPSFTIAATMTHDVVLPRGGLVEGTVVSGGAPVPTAVVRLFEQNCSDATTCAAPWLRGQAVTDMNGAFRVVVPLPNDD